MQIEFEGEVFRPSARREDWYFATLPADVSELIREIPRPLRGFGAVRVAVRIGASSWRISVFPDAERGIYVLPLERVVRDAEGISDGGTVVVSLAVLGVRPTRQSPSAFGKDTPNSHSSHISH